MSFLEAIWELSLLLAGVALAIVAGLIVARLLAERRSGRREAQRQWLVPALLGSGPFDAERAKTIEPEVVAEVSLHLIQMVRGEERQAFVRRATELGVPRRLSRMVRSGSARTRLAAAQAMSAFPDRDCVDALREALDDPNPDVRLAAALSIAEAGDTSSASGIVPRLGHSGDASLLSVTLLKRIASDRPEVVKGMLTSASVQPPARVAAVEALVSSGDYALVPIIADLALNTPDDAEELPRYLRALGQLAHPAGRSAVIDGLGRPSMAARAAAAGAAGKIGLTEAAGKLSGLLDDPEWWVRFRAAEALLALGPEGQKLLDAAACLGTPRARDTARTMLAERGIAT